MNPTKPYLRQLSPFDAEHLPEEVLLIEALMQRFPSLPQMACFHTAFHHDLPPCSSINTDPPAI